MLKKIYAHFIVVTSKLLYRIVLVLNEKVDRTFPDESEHIDWINYETLKNQFGGRA